MDGGDREPGEYGLRGDPPPTAPPGFTGTRTTPGTAEKEDSTSARASASDITER
ncbi:hypothetical protein [Methanoculleus chikugoensis]|uniref:hypothetical protein n=1 Tax=Methanoculleus chikugoensis TaxID=118126 RepID=UPI001FB1F3BF|nr:hypothetical protein [Methanoculleus chikugoensis]